MTIQVDIDEFVMMGLSSGWSPVGVGICHQLFIEAYGWMFYNNGLLITEFTNLN